MARKVKITVEIDAEDLLYIMYGNSGVAVASEGGDDELPDSGTGNGDNNNNGNNNNSGNGENTGRPGVGTGIAGPGRPDPDTEGNE